MFIFHDFWTVRHKYDIDIKTVYYLIYFDLFLNLFNFWILQTYNVVLLPMYHRRYKLYVSLTLQYVGWYSCRAWNTEICICPENGGSFSWWGCTRWMEIHVHSYVSNICSVTWGYKFCVYILIVYVFLFLKRVDTGYIYKPCIFSLLTIDDSNIYF